MLIFMSPSHHPYPFVNVKLPLQSPERRVKRERKEQRALLHFSIDVEIWKEIRIRNVQIRVTCRTTLLYVPALPSGAAAHPPFTSKGLEERRAAVSAELETEESELFSFTSHWKQLRAAAWVSLWQCSLFIAANFKRSFSWSASYQDVAGNVCDTMLCAKLFPVRLFSCLVCQLSVLNYFCLVWWDFLSDLEGFVYYIYM